MLTSNRTAISITILKNCWKAGTSWPMELTVESKMKFSQELTHHNKLFGRLFPCEFWNLPASFILKPNYSCFDSRNSLFSAVREKLELTAVSNVRNLVHGIGSTLIGQTRVRRDVTRDNSFYFCTFFFFCCQWLWKMLWYKFSFFPPLLHFSYPHFVQCEYCKMNSANIYHDTLAWFLCPCKFHCPLQLTCHTYF